MHASNQDKGFQVPIFRHEKFRIWECECLNQNNINGVICDAFSCANELWYAFISCMDAIMQRKSTENWRFDV